MASTRRESTARLRSEENSDAAGSLPIPALGFGPHLSTPVPTTSQGRSRSALPIREPWVRRVGDAVDIAIALLFDGPGATVSVTDGNMAGRNLYAVSIYPERTFTLNAPPTRRQLFAYAHKNVVELLKPGRALGIWHNVPQKRYELDIVLCIPDLAAAIVLGYRHRQSCIYDLAVGQEIHLSRHAPASLPLHAGRHD